MYQRIAGTQSRTLVSTRTETHDYIYASGTLLRDVITTTVDGTTTIQTLDFRYDENGHPYELIRTVGETTTSYYYITNLQGDVMHLVDGEGTVVASYTYDPYGNILTETGDLAEENPLRYRGYYYDEETGFYYVSSRYYDAKIKRFINADAIELIGVNGDFTSINLFVYCGSDPINKKDITGYAWSWAAALLGAVVNVATTYIAAKATGQDYTWRDALVAAGTGAANVISPWFSGLGSGLYAYVTAKEKGASNKEALMTGFVSGICTTMSMSNIANHFVPNIVTLAESTVLDLTYGVGTNIISASVNRIIMDKVEAKTSAGSGKSLIKKVTVASGMQSASRYGLSIAYKQ